MRPVCKLLGCVLLPLACVVACDGGDAPPNAPSEVVEQCEASCPTCDGADVFLMAGTPDHEAHKADAEKAEEAAEKKGYWFNDANGLTDSTQAQRIIYALEHLPADEIRTLVFAYHGHGSVGQLDLDDGSTLTYADLFAAIAKVKACKVIISNDSCFSGSMFADMPDNGLGTCETVAASATSAATPSSCTNGLSKVFVDGLIADQEPRAALEAAAASPGVQGNQTAGEVQVIANPECACGCVPRTKLGDGSGVHLGQGGQGGSAGTGGSAGSDGGAGGGGNGGAGGTGATGGGSSVCAPSSDACTSCMHGACCSELEACDADATCKGALGAFESCAGDQIACAEIFSAAGGELANAAVGCMFQQCEAACVQ